MNWVPFGRFQKGQARKSWDGNNPDHGRWCVLVNRRFFGQYKHDQLETAIAVCLKAKKDASAQKARTKEQAKAAGYTVISPDKTSRKRTSRQVDEALT
eukprot:COSAG01_NODE_29793_length_629_cov_1.456604_1_plen_97_part_10